MDGFEGIKTSEEKVTVHVVGIARELELEAWGYELIAAVSWMESSFSWVNKKSGFLRWSYYEGVEMTQRI